MTTVSRMLNCNGRKLDLSVPRVMGVLNVTPDSFSDGGAFLSVSSVLAQARRMVEEGAALIDVGGESTRPGAAPVSVEDELKRVVPVVEALAAELNVPISVDTSKPEVMRAAVAAGAGLINDVVALQQSSALEAAASLGVPVCIMHMQGTPRTMQMAPHYHNVVDEVLGFLLERADVLHVAGIPREHIVIDPGFGFGKTLEHNCRLLRDLNVFVATGYPVLVGLSRKSMIGKILGLPVGQRLFGSLSAAVVAAWQGAALVRTHDVKATAEALMVSDAVLRLG